MVLAGLVSLNMLLPARMVVAAEQISQPAVTAPKKMIGDVSLAKSGTLNGRVVDQRGATIDGAVVTVSQGAVKVSETVTNANGEFAVSGLKGGVYHVQAAGTESVVRAWTERTAPPAASAQVLLVTQDETVVNGQDGCCNCPSPWALYLVGGLAAAALAVGTVALVETNNNNPATP